MTHAMTSSHCEFQHTESHTSGMAVSNTLPLLSTLFILLGWNSVQKSTKIYSVTLRVTLHSGAWMKFSLYFPQLWSDLGDILYKGCAHNTVQNLSVFWQSAPANPYSSDGCKWNYMYICTVQQDDILKVKNTLISLWTVRQNTAFAICC
jgi:hypothetical protein